MSPLTPTSTPTADAAAPISASDQHLQDRAHGALLGLALGDALGMPTQSLPREVIAARFGHLTGFYDAGQDQPIAPGMSAGSVTDDTEQAVLLGELLLDGAGRIEPTRFAEALLAWERSMVARGSRDLLGPSTKAALNALQAGASAKEAGKYGTTNGSAMRVGPVGLVFRPGPRLMEAVVESAAVTHNTGLGISAAAAVAHGVSAGIEGAGVTDALAVAIEAARKGERLGHWVAGASIPARFTALLPLARQLPEQQFTDFLYDVVGTSVQSQESVVSALLIVDRYRRDPWSGLCAAASLGGDTDTVAAIAGALLGACCGTAAFPIAESELVTAKNHLDLAGLARRLIAMRA